MIRSCLECYRLLEDAAFSTHEGLCDECAAEAVAAPETPNEETE